MKNVHIKALQLLIENKVSQFPVDPETLESSKKEWYIHPYNDDYDIIEKNNLGGYAERNDSFVMLDEDGDYHIFFDNRLGTESKARAIWHELAHICLNHTASYSVINNVKIAKFENKEHEEEAEIFRIWGCSVIPVLSAIGETIPLYISNLTGLSTEDSIIASNELETFNPEIYQKEHAEILGLFKEFIDNQTRIKEELSKKRYELMLEVDKTEKMRVREEKIDSILKAVLIFLIFVFAILCISLYSKFKTTKNYKETTNISSTSVTTTANDNTHTVLDTTSDTKSLNPNEQVFITETGKKFHREDCQYIKDKTNLKIYIIEEAEELGYSACEKCFK